MSMQSRWILRTLVVATVLSGAVSVFGQTPSAPTTAQQTTAPSTAPEPTATRPATTTTNGDTGLWFVPTGDVLPSRKWSVSAYRVNFDRNQGFSDVSDWP